MNELPAIPWGKVISNFVWILGAAIILAAVGYQEFLARLRREVPESREKEGRKTGESRENKPSETARRTGLGSEGFKKPFFLGLALIFAGASAALSRPFVSAILGIFSFMAAVVFGKKIMRGGKT